MVAKLIALRTDPGLRNALDWTVFGIGAVSLSLAIAATVLTPGPAPEKTGPTVIERTAG